jgi:hypothetical protein
MNGRFWLSVALVIATIIMCGVLIWAGKAGAQASGPKPVRGEWLCWATNSKAECGTYGWHKRQPVALKAALDLCGKQCGTGCVEDYCEVLK